jgi:hypothetical protein
VALTQRVDRSQHHGGRGDPGASTLPPHPAGMGGRQRPDGYPWLVRKMKTRLKILLVAWLAGAGGLMRTSARGLRSSALLYPDLLAGLEGSNAETQRFAERRGEVLFSAFLRAPSRLCPKTGLASRLRLCRAVSSATLRSSRHSGFGVQVSFRYHSEHHRRIRLGYGLHRGRVLAETVGATGVLAIAACQARGLGYGAGTRALVGFG